MIGKPGSGMPRLSRTSSPMVAVHVALRRLYEDGNILVVSRDV